MLYLILLLPFLLGIGCAFCKEENARRLTPVLAAAQTVLTALVIYAAVSGKDWATNVVYLSESLTFSLKMDGVAAVFAVVTAVCWLLTIPYAAVYMPHSGGEPRFYVFLFTTEAVLLGTALAADMVTLYLFYELTTLCSAPLVLHELKKKAIIGAYKYLFYSVGGAFVALFGVVVLYFHCGSLSFVAGGTMTEATPLTLAAVFCMILGFGAKAGLFPLHNWLPSAHPAAPAPASALLSGLIAKAGVIAVLRTIFFTAGAGLLRGTWVQTVCLILVLISIFMGSFMGCLEKELKKRLAYSSISQISYVLLVCALACDFPLRIMAKEQLFKIPIIGGFIRRMGAFPVDRGNSDIGAIKNSIKSLREGFSLLIFPEGTRVKKGQKVRPKGGVTMIAIRAGANLLPVFIGTTKRLFHKIPLIIGKPYAPVYTERKGTAEEYQQNADEIMRQVYELGGVQ